MHNFCGTANLFQATHGATILWRRRMAQWGTLKAQDPPCAQHPPDPLDGEPNSLKATGLVQHAHAVEHHEFRGPGPSSVLHGATSTEAQPRTAPEQRFVEANIP